jgi:hypothetical protein
MTQRISPLWLTAVLVTGLGALMLLSAALYNGYPTTFWDTRAYVEHAGSLLPRPDRLIGYSIFMRALSWHITLWPVVIAQCLLSAWLICRVTAVLLQRRSARHALLLTAALTVGTALPWVAGQLMADIFTSALVLSLWLLIEADDLERTERWWLLGLVALCVSVHLTHLPLGLGLLVFALLLGRRDRLRAPGAALLVGVVAIGGFNFARTGRFSLASGGDAFLLAHLVEAGLASHVLDAHCQERDYLLCSHRRELPMSTDEFLWVDKLHIEPWLHEREIKREARRLLRDSLIEHPIQHLQVAVRYTAAVLARFRTGEGLDADAAYLIEPQIARYAPGDLPRYRAARQQASALPVETLRAIHTPIGWALLGASLFLVGAAFFGARRAQLSVPARYLAFVLAALFINAALSANLSGIYDRYQSRIMWLLGVGLWAWMGRLSSSGRTSSFRGHRPATEPVEGAATTRSPS